MNPFSLNKKYRKTDTTRYIMAAAVMLGLLAAGCKPKYPKGIMQPDEIKPVLFDVMVATELRQMDTAALAKLHIRDSVTLEIHRVLKAHNVDDSLYFRSMAFYEAHPDELKTLLDSTRSYGNKIQDSLQKKRFTTIDSTKKGTAGPVAVRPHPDSAIKSPKNTENPSVKSPVSVPVEKVKNHVKKL
ncbi:protein of unknown function [Arachidicoccus rhizosphaerae]|uniref:DUF4296 domain-containing protein n=1 Tax=Arachidicoccus rhizosphaerae TaxID=551991 RepID=A0A1H3X066_9BACT|nr:DUF4296 domain-containing protein [Arachidicoccus rhizosphaerae]SDZ92064.1 protein of unknown function [Arachidicoccus rhizosphaerae]